MRRLLPPERDIGVLQAPVRSCLALTGIFLLVLLSVGLLERIGIAAGAALTAVVGAAFALFVLASLLSHSRRAIDFYVADRKIAAAFGGLAAGGTFAGLVTIGLLGGAYASDMAFLATAGGLIAGYLVLAVLIAPGLRTFGAYTAGDFLATRFGGSWARLLWAIIAFTVSLLLFIAELKVAAPLVAMLLRITPEHALYATAGLTAVAALPGGMRSLTWTQAIQFFVIALACLVPIGFLVLSGTEAESPIAQDFGALLINNLPPLSAEAIMQSAMPALLAAMGAASLPQLMARPLTTPSAREAGTSMVWGALLSAMLVASGLVLADLLAATFTEPVSGSFDLFTTILATLPAVLSGLFLAGTLAALFAFGQAALFAGATALSHDIFDEILDRKGPEGRRIVVARLMVIGVAAGGAALVLRWQADAQVLVEWSLAFAAGGSFAPLILALHWRRCNEIGAVSGMAVGFGFTGLVFLMAQKMLPAAMVSGDWAGVGAPTAALVGLLMAIVATVALSLATPSPARVPHGETSDGGPAPGAPIRERPA